MNSAKMIFGGILVTILLGIYVYLVLMAVLVVKGALARESFTAEMASSLSLIGGLVSALVIAELAVTNPGETPGTRILGAEKPAAATNRVFVTAVFLYLTVWTLAGLVAFILGYLQHQGELTALTDMGQGWIGVAIAAGYSYFGIKPAEKKDQAELSKAAGQN